MSTYIKTLGGSVYAKFKEASSEEEAGTIKKKGRTKTKIDGMGNDNTHLVGMERFQQESFLVGSSSSPSDRWPVKSVSSKQESRWQRRIPPLGIHDTVIGIGYGMVSLHGSPNFMRDDEIVKVGAISGNKTIDPEITIHHLESGKAILQQQSMKGASAASVAMLFLDHGHRPDLQKLRRANSGVIKLQQEQAKLFGLKLETTFVGREHAVSSLSLLLRQAGSGVVRLEDPLLGIHYVVVDEIADNWSWVRLRDPYHALEMTVTGLAFSERFKGGEVLQVISRDVRET
ncbi:hypothetical protein [Estrella lausannensis]|uniref:Peptidase C39 domain-containing protein n=1 Tax=Estrella lausannensis TaxID=483423 RepID=A0A0H5DR65_9BACT|nr:hypothetical protein [Estrella lausannensis]CRX38653.1 Hypothetical protein ELAC_1314 [Estrella lausannensis]